jgi:hypothetical protein
MTRGSAAAASASRVRARRDPIVFHAQHDGVVPFEEGRQLAAGIAESTFVPLASRNHLLLEHEPAWGIFLRELGAFLGWRDAD